MNSDSERMAAVLLDVMEDSIWCLEDLRKEGFSDAVVDAVEFLTDAEGISYDAYIERLSANSIAR